MSGTLGILAVFKTSKVPSHPHFAAPILLALKLN